MNHFKTVFPFLIIAAFLFLVSLFNTLVVRGMVKKDDNMYHNELNRKLLDNNIADIDYNYLINDLNKIDRALKDALINDFDISKKGTYYREAQNVYDNKINEITAILNQKLDDEDFEALIANLDEFYKNIDFASDEIKNTIKSSVDAVYNINKYMYEEKQRKCREIIEEYKGFLSKT